MDDLLFVMPKKYNLEFRTMIMLDKEIRKHNRDIENLFIQELKKDLGLNNVLYYREKDPKIRHWIECSTINSSKNIDNNFELTKDDLLFLRDELNRTLSMLTKYTEKFEHFEVVNKKSYLEIMGHSALVIFEEFFVKDFYQVINSQNLWKLKKEIDYIFENNFFEKYHIGFEMR